MATQQHNEDVNEFNLGLEKDIEEDQETVAKKTSQNVLDISNNFTVNIIFQLNIFSYIYFKFSNIAMLIE